MIRQTSSQDSRTTRRNRSAMMPPTPSKTPRTFTVLVLGSLVLAAIVVRLAFLAEVHHLPTYTHLQSDELAAHQAGVACMEGNLPSHAYLKAPLYMYALGYLYKAVGPDPYRARLVQAVLSSFIVLIVYLIARQLFGTTAALLAGVIAAFYWVFVNFAVELVDASLASLFYLVLAYLLAVGDHRKTWPWVAAGAVMAVGAMTRPNVLIAAPFLAIALLVLTYRRLGADSAEPSPAQATPRPARRALLNTLALTLGCCAVIAPVTIRNRIVGGEWVLIAAYGGLNLWVSNNPDSDGKNVAYIVGRSTAEAAPIDPNDVWSDALGDRVARRFAEKVTGRQLSRGQLDAFYARLALDYISDQPRKFLRDTLHRCVWLFNAYEFATVRNPYILTEFSRVLRALSWAHFGILCPLIVLGLAAALVTRPRPPGLTYNLILIATMALGGIFFVVNSRFRVPLVYLSVPFAAYGLTMIPSLVRSGLPLGKRLFLVAALIAAAVLANLDLFDYRPDYHTDLRFARVAASWEAKNKPLLAMAAPQLEEALARDRETGQQTWATLLTHARPNSLLFASYALLNDLEKTFHYGYLMAFEQPFHPSMCRPFFGFLIKAGPQHVYALLNDLFKAERRDAARELLDMVWMETTDDRVLAYTEHYTQLFDDEAFLARAEAHLIDRLRQSPDDPALTQLLKRLQARMTSMGLPTTSAPSPASHPATRGSGSDA